MSSGIRLGATVVQLPPGRDARVYALLGDPVAHSLSPAMQQAALDALGLAGVYVACRVVAADLARVFEDLRALAAQDRLGGVNVTVPHKTAVVRWLDACDAGAGAAGAVNTICVQRDGVTPRFRGFNTDLEGLVRVLVDAGVALRGARVVIVGAGGMGRAAATAAFRAGAAEVFVAARHELRAQDMLDAISRAWRGALPALGCGSFAAAEARLASADVLVHATPLGLHPDDGVAVALDRASTRLFVCDTVYGPGPTPLVRAAQARGLRSIDGRALLLHQGAAAFTLWTGLEAPLAVMRAALAGPHGP